MSSYRSLDWFTHQMEKKLRANSHKGGWSKMTFRELNICLREELIELEEALDGVADDQLEGDVGNATLDAVVSECADLANFAMMLADNAQRCHSMPRPRMLEARSKARKSVSKKD